MITGVLVRNWNPLSPRSITGNEKWCYRQQCSAYVRWYQNERRKYGVSWAFMIFPTVTSVMKSHLRVRNASVFTIFDCRFPTQSVLRTKYRHDTPYYNPIKTFDIVPAFEEAICYGEAMKIAGSKYSAQVWCLLAKTLWHGCRHPTRLRARISWNDVIDAGATLRWEKRLMTVTENTTYTLNSI